MKGREGGPFQLRSGRGREGKEMGARKKNNGGLGIRDRLTIRKRKIVPSRRGKEGKSYVERRKFVLMQIENGGKKKRELTVARHVQRWGREETYVKNLTTWEPRRKSRQSKKKLDR